MNCAALTIARRLAHTLIRDVLLVQADVAGDGAGEDERVLQHRADVPAQVGLREVRTSWPSISTWPRCTS